MYDDFLNQIPTVNAEKHKEVVSAVRKSASHIESRIQDEKIKLLPNKNDIPQSRVVPVSDGVIGTHQQYPYRQPPHSPPSYQNERPKMFMAQSRLLGAPYKSILLPEQKKEEGWLTKTCPCLKPQFYSDYFEATTEVVRYRLLCGLKADGAGCAQFQAPYEMYGPVWINYTLAFCLGAVYNALNYQTEEQFEYNMQSVMLAFFVTSFFGLGGNMLMTYLVNAAGLELPYLKSQCIYGYSQTLHIVSTIICVYNSCTLHWVLPIGAAVAQMYFFYSAIGKGANGSPKVFFMALLGIHAILMLIIIKVNFLGCPTPVVSQSIPNSHFLHIRFRN